MPLMLKRTCGVLLLVAITAPQVIAQTREDFFAKLCVLNPVKVFIPPARQGANPPLLIGLHGRGDTASGMAFFWDTLKDPKPILVLPEAPYPLVRSGLEPSIGWSWDFPSEDRKLWEVADPLVVTYILDVIREVQTKHPTSGVYILGHSQGVSYGYMAMAQAPDLIKGMIAVAGILPPPDLLSDDALKQAAGRSKVYIAHGNLDQQINLKISVKAKARLESLGFRVIFKEFADGHRVPKEELLAIQEWINSCEKPEP